MPKKTVTPAKPKMTISEFVSNTTRRLADEWFTAAVREMRHPIYIGYKPTAEPDIDGEMKLFFDEEALPDGWFFVHHPSLFPVSRAITKEQFRYRLYDAMRQLPILPWEVLRG